MFAPPELTKTMGSTGLAAANRAVVSTLPSVGAALLMRNPTRICSTFSTAASEDDTVTVAQCVVPVANPRGLAVSLSMPPVTPFAVTASHGWFADAVQGMSVRPNELNTGTSRVRTERAGEGDCLKATPAAPT